MFTDKANRVSNFQSQVARHNNLGNQNVNLATNTENSLQTVTTNLSLANINNQCQLYRENRLQLKNSQERIMTSITESTKEEVKQVETAINNLNKKVESVLKTPLIEKEKKKMENSQKIMNISLKNAMDAFEEGKRQIENNKDLNNETKQRYISQMYEKLMSKLYTPQEIQAFQNMFSNVVFIMPQESMRNQRSLPSNKYT